MKTSSSFKSRLCLVAALVVPLLGHAHDCHSQTVPGDASTYAPLPTTATSPPLNSRSWRVEHFGRGAYMVADARYNALFLEWEKGVLLVDAPPSMGDNLAHAIGNTTRMSVTHLVYSHAHVDHIAGASHFPGAKIIAHRDTRELLQRNHDPRRLVPDIVFDDRYDLHVGNQSLELTYKGVNHQRGNIFIYAPLQRILMLVDVIYPGWVPFGYLSDAASVPGVIEAHDRALDFTFDHFIAGHGRAGSRHDVETSRAYLDDLKNNCQKAIRLSNDPNSPLSGAKLTKRVLDANPGNGFAVVKTLIDSMAHYCGNMTTYNWLGKLGAADVFGYENAYSMVQSLRLD
ncbi:hypothetical protein HIM_07584 [Hirsutella minnesotensis 3608]|uniref:Metallo-beta-lactamase domain-containing protein n=1 Tax=Hirsutella minnesotensis 3608 TaxID=1043627 RepID=A0A0F7ZYT1_9HYPO|nr:hypothetical protein HIM_07584 [Hirsutella minnesotensis 3608]